MAQWICVFEELPYAAALNDEYLSARCSNCFVEASMPCMKCKKAVYCNDRCSSADWPWHEIECAAGPHLVSCDIRLMARFGRRQQIDGGVASLSTNFPSSYKARTCKELMSHFRDMKRDKRRQDRMEKIWSMWKEHLANSPMSTMKKAVVQRLYCTLCINTFGIFESGTVDQQRAWAVIGVGLYLNASRFNHSCNPDLSVQFAGNRMAIIRQAEEGEQSGVMKEKDFNRLTINYGVPSSDGHGSFIPLTSQRIESLQSRYYFKCRCVKCVDKTAKTLEESAAAIECPKCKQPYVWQGRSVKLQPMCSCDVKRRKLDPVDRLLVKQLNSSWEQEMNKTDYLTNKREVIAACKPVWLLAKKYWHPVVNLRLAQLNERLFRAYVSQLTKPGRETTEAESTKNFLMAVTTGESVVAAYDFRAHNDVQLAVFYCQLATLYEAMEGAENPQKAEEWYTKAANVFRLNGDAANESLVLSWRSKSSSGSDDKAAPAHRPISMNVIEAMQL